MKGESREDFIKRNGGDKPFPTHVAAELRAIIAAPLPPKRKESPPDP